MKLEMNMAFHFIKASLYKPPEDTLEDGTQAALQKLLQEVGTKHSMCNSFRRKAAA